MPRFPAVFGIKHIGIFTDDPTFFRIGEENISEHGIRAAPLQRPVSAAIICRGDEALVPDSPSILRIGKVDGFEVAGDVSFLLLPRFSAVFRVDDKSFQTDNPPQFRVDEVDVGKVRLPVCLSCRFSPDAPVEHGECAYQKRDSDWRCIVFRFHFDSLYLS